MVYDSNKATLASQVYNPALCLFTQITQIPATAADALGSASLVARAREPVRVRLKRDARPVEHRRNMQGKISKIHKAVLGRRARMVCRGS